MTADRHMQEASSVIDQWDEQKADLSELHRLIATALAAAEKRGREDDGWNVGHIPQDGTPIYIQTVQPYRFMPYKPNSQQFKRGEKGRWQMMNEYGGWDNCSHPLGNKWRYDLPAAIRARKDEP